jgi:hypothetical protein
MEKDGDVSPMFIAFKEGVCHLYVTPFHDDEEKLVMLSVLQVVFNKNKYEGYIFMNEVWMVQRDIDKAKLNTRVSEQPDRQEALMVLLVTKENNQCVIMNVQREGAKVTLDAGKKIDGIEGRFSELLKPIPETSVPSDDVLNKMVDFLNLKPENVTFH